MENCETFCSLARRDDGAGRAAGAVSPATEEQRSQRTKEAPRATPQPEGLIRTPIRRSRNILNPKFTRFSVVRFFNSLLKHPLSILTAMSDTEKPPKVLLIGWDAADWKAIMPLIDEDKLPNLEKF